MILNRHDGIHRGQVEAGGGRGPGKPAVNRDSQDKPDRIHMTEAHTGEVGVTEGKVGETGGMARLRPGRGGWMAACF